MGRSIPSITQRMERIIARWQAMGKRLDDKDRKAVERILAEVRNRRSAIDPEGEDLEYAMLLAALIGAYGEKDGGQQKLADK